MDNTTITYHDRDIRIYGFAEDHIFKTIRKSQFFYEPKMLTRIEKLTNLGTVLDVGANIGNHTLFFASFTDAEKIVSIEPYKKVRDVLIKNISTNLLEDKVIVIGKAIDMKPGEVTLRPAGNQNIGMTRTVQGKGINSTTLDELSSGEVVGLIKIDIEGNELRALKGAVDVLSNQKPHLFVEASTKVRFENINDYLRKFGYRCQGKYNWTDTYHFCDSGVSFG